MKVFPRQETMDMPDEAFPIKVLQFSFDERCTVVENHWHEHMEFLCVKRGCVTARYNNQPVEGRKDSILIINSNEIHSIECSSDDLEYFCVIVDMSLLRSGFADRCQQKYITPISKNLILFQNHIPRDPALTKCLSGIACELECREDGYELAVKAHQFQLLSILVRKYVGKVLTLKESDNRMKNLNRFKGILSYIEQNFDDRITMEELSRMANLSTYHFCHLFKEVTGKTFTTYVNDLRLNKASYLLQNTDLSITEIGLLCGFNDINYFSRMYKKHRSCSPSAFRKA